MVGFFCISYALLGFYKIAKTFWYVLEMSTGRGRDGNFTLRPCPHPLIPFCIPKNFPTGNGAEIPHKYYAWIKFPTGKYSSLLFFNFFFCF